MPSVLKNTLDKQMNYYDLFNLFYKNKKQVQGHYGSQCECN